MLAERSAAFWHFGTLAMTPSTLLLVDPTTTTCRHPLAQRRLDRIAPTQQPLPVAPPAMLSATHLLPLRAEPNLLLPASAANQRPPATPPRSAPHLASRSSTQLARAPIHESNSSQRRGGARRAGMVHGRSSPGPICKAARSSSPFDPSLPVPCPPPSYQLRGPVRSRAKSKGAAVTFSLLLCCTHLYHLALVCLFSSAGVAKNVGASRCLTVRAAGPGAAAARSPRPRPLSCLIRRRLPAKQTPHAPPTCPPGTARQTPPPRKYDHSKTLLEPTADWPTCRPIPSGSAFSSGPFLRLPSYSLLHFPPLPIIGTAVVQPYPPHFQPWDQHLSPNRLRHFESDCFWAALAGHSSLVSCSPEKQKRKKISSHSLRPKFARNRIPGIE